MSPLSDGNILNPLQQKIIEQVAGQTNEIDLGRSHGNNLRVINLATNVCNLDVMVPGQRLHRFECLSHLGSQEGMEDDVRTARCEA
eukprot:CAMPEP_0198501016 /NCGR_PEP_ID=MMETSP1462-20131121/8473_1 /TAXON_ID=1333877 /ORGANISM="Brandtodinium nutriculum, Strain RCC3387" /LENGTH=85 /DNA_ID=CAMNT_0044230039 /DNA_START=162 /DNA_END=417 /DNA_ORIENTATION=-